MTKSLRHLKTLQCLSISASTAGKCATQLTDHNNHSVRLNHHSVHRTIYGRSKRWVDAAIGVKTPVRDVRPH